MSYSESDLVQKTGDLTYALKLGCIKEKQFTQRTWHLSHTKLGLIR